MANLSKLWDASALVDTWSTKLAMSSTSFWWANVQLVELLAFSMSDGSLENASSHGLLYGPAPAYCGHSVESLVLSEQRWVQMAVWSFEGWLVSDSSSNNCFDELAGVG